MQAWAARHEGSLLLATAWSGSVFGPLHDQLPGQVQVKRMEDIGLELQRADAVKLLKHNMISSRRAELQSELPDEQLQSLAHSAATALQFSRPPAYVPQVLLVGGRTLGVLAERPETLKELQQRLRSADEPAMLAATDLPQRDKLVFSQLLSCIKQLSPTAQRIFVDVGMAGWLWYGGTIAELALWLSCHQDIAEVDVTRHVSQACYSASLAARCLY